MYLRRSCSSSCSAMLVVERAAAFEGDSVPVMTRLETTFAALMLASCCCSLALL